MQLNMDYNFSKSNETVSFPEGAMSMLYAILLILLILLNFSCQFKFFIGFICLLILSLVTNILAANDLSYFVFPFALAAITSYTLFVITQVFHFLTFLLAAERVLVYFFRSTEEKISLFQNFLKNRIQVLYRAFVVRDFVFVIYTVKSDSENVWHFTNHTVLYSIMFVSIDNFIFISAVFYIPIYVSVRKLAYLASAQENKPQRYIFWKTITVLLFKSFYVPLAISLIFFNGDYLEAYLIIIAFLNILTTPLVIQISYLGSNRRTLQSFKETLQLKQSSRLCCRTTASSSVQPEKF
ncbi:Serpentine Receptor, class Z [Caenorhabditis elegans]|uniref:Serpentine Receptor, class Z n=1 Tax=Caenorhabditis elegans TaxID=6239 RepID=A0A060Q5Z9_CAEEL|nr:Serpentine Receptor, class Z [Caenorhabditis elegans]CCE71861.2 Serpentine Receptor, class Z [Caenorhabditis elegans]|eukprot:NP_001294221.1 Serpentine Receptor, class Z [Caenorhabditis elegans]